MNANEKYCDVLRFFSNPFRGRFFLQSFFLPHKNSFRAVTRESPATSHDARGRGGLARVAGERGGGR